jgi:hypothetical protein
MGIIVSGKTDDDSHLVGWHFRFSSLQYCPVTTLPFHPLETIARPFGFKYLVQAGPLKLLFQPGLFFRFSGPWPNHD